MAREDGCVEDTLAVPKDDDLGGRTTTELAAWTERVG